MLAGGRAERFGADKLAEPLRGHPLLHHAIRVLADLCDEVVVVTAPEEEPGLPPEAKAPVRIAHDPAPHAGPLAGVVEGMRAAATPLVLVVGGDMPTMSPAVLRELVDDAHETGAGAVALAEGEEIRPLPCVLFRSELGVAERLLAAGERSIRALLGAVGVRAFPEETWRALDPEAATLFDVDRREDLGAKSAGGAGGPTVG